MFYSELLLRICSEAEPGEGAGKLLRRHGGRGLSVVLVVLALPTPTTPLPKATESLEEGPQMLTLLLKTFQKRRIKEKKKSKKM